MGSSRVTKPVSNSRLTFGIAWVNHSSEVQAAAAWVGVVSNLSEPKRHSSARRSQRQSRYHVGVRCTAIYNTAPSARMIPTRIQVERDLFDRDVHGTTVSGQYFAESEKLRPPRLPAPGPGKSLPRQDRRSIQLPHDNRR